MVKCFSLFQSHRVVLPDDADSSRRSRFSIVNFQMPRIDAVITPVGDKKEYQPFTVMDLIKAHKATYVLAQSNVVPIQSLQWRHLISALIARAARAWYTWCMHAHVWMIATQFPGHGSMDELNVALIHKLRRPSMWLAYFLLYFTYYSWVFVRPVNWRRN